MEQVNITVTDNKADNSIENLRRTVQTNPNNITARVDLAVALIQEYKLAEAEQHFRIAIKQDPHSGVLYYNLGLVLHLQDRHEESEEAYKKSTDIDPKNPHFWCNRSRNLFEWGKYKEAEYYCNKALQLDDTFLLNLFNLGEIHLMNGNYALGWAYYEARPPVGMRVHHPRYKDHPHWWGEDIEGKTILLHAEQGFGDTFQFCRYFQVLESMGADVILEVQRELVPLLRATYGKNVLGYGDEFPEHDYQCPLITAGGILTPTIDDIPCGEYLSPPFDVECHWHKALAGLPYKVGVNWKGRGATMPQLYPNTSIIHTGTMATRDIPVEHFIKLTNFAPSIDWIALQKDANVPSLIRSFKDIDKEPFVDTAAIMKCLDLVITNDTAIAHLAGAMGVPVWVALPHVANWRWLLNRDDSPWYPSMRLFRQPKPGDWDSVFTSIRSELIKEIQGC